MKVGDIVRRFFKESEICFGNYYQVTQIEGECVYAKVLNVSTTNDCYIGSIRSFKTLSVRKLRISNSDFDRIVSGALVHIHPMRKVWIDLAKNPVDVVILYDYNHRKVYYAKPEFKLVLINRRQCVKMYLDHQICIFLKPQ